MCPFSTSEITQKKHKQTDRARMELFMYFMSSSLGSSITVMI